MFSHSFVSYSLDLWMEWNTSSIYAFLCHFRSPFCEMANRICSTEIIVPHFYDTDLFPNVYLGPNLSKVFVMILSFYHLRYWRGFLIHWVYNFFSFHWLQRGQRKKRPSIYIKINWDQSFLWWNFTCLKPFLSFLWKLKMSLNTQTNTTWSRISNNST